MSKRRGEHIQQGKGKPLDTNVTKVPDLATPAASSGGAPSLESAPEDPNALGKYWIAILVWCVGFALMIVIELFAALFRR